MSLKTKSVVVQEVSDEVAAAVDRVFRNGKISATTVARQILDNNPDCSMTVDELAGWIGRLATTRGVAVEFSATAYSQFQK